MSVYLKEESKCYVQTRDNDSKIASYHSEYYYEEHIYTACEERSFLTINSQQWQLIISSIVIVKLSIILFASDEAKTFTQST